MGCSLRSLFLEQLKGEALLLIAALGCAVQNSSSLCCAVWCPVLLSVSLGSFGLDISAFSLRGPYHKPQLSSLGSQMFVPLGTMPISFVLLLVGLAMSWVTSQKHQVSCLLRPCSQLHHHPFFPALSCNILGLIRLYDMESILNAALSYSHLDHHDQRFL